jgi:antitoxin PrlF
MSVSVIRAKGQVTIPQDIREAAHLEEGDPVEIEITPDGILLRPKKLIDASEAWFWSREWQHGEREASADIKARVPRRLTSNPCRPSPRPIDSGATSNS